MTRSSAPAPPVAQPAATAPPTRPPKHRDFKPALARATPPAVPSPARTSAPVALAAVARGAAPVPIPVAARIAPPLPASNQPVDLRPWETQTNPAFRQRIAEAERSAEHAAHGYGLRNPSSGALGRYQFLPIALRDIGWMDAEGRRSPHAARHGVSDEASFLASPAAQEAAMSAYLARQEVILDRIGTLGATGTTITGLDGRPIMLSEGAMVAAAHRRGAGMLARYIAHRTDTPDAPLTPAQRSAFESVEGRLRGFSEIAYVSERPANRLLARRGGPASS